MADILARILEVKAREVESARSSRPLAAVRDAARSAPPARDFAEAIRSRIQAGEAAVIAEVKKASPSKGVLREHFDPGAIARSYASHGAACLSVLTDEQFFQGRPEHLRLAREASGIPALRKDFIVDAYQVYESRALGADAVLLIVAALDPGKIKELEALAFELRMAVLVEVHDRRELDVALQLQTPFLGINNRDLRTFKTTLDTTLQLLGVIPPGRTVVTESGILEREHVVKMQQAGVQAFLVGEAFMRADDPGKALHDLFSSP